jgi:hypothetical protein
MAGFLYIPEPLQQAIAAHINEAVPRAIEGYLSAHEDEDTLTGHLGATLRTGTQTVFVQDQELGFGEWKWKIDYRKFRGRGPKAAESVLGADGLFELTLLRGTREETKSLLFQAKKEWKVDTALFGQAVRLTTWREAAFILNYTPKDFEAIRLDDAVSSRGSRAAVTQAVSLSHFLTNEYLPCHIGDTDVRYDAVNHRLIWRTMNDEVVTAEFSVGSRIRLDIKAPKSRPITQSQPRVIYRNEIHNHRMKAKDEDVLGVSADALEKEKKQARNQLALTYHPDRFSSDDEYLKSILSRRTQEANAAYANLKKR